VSEESIHIIGAVVGDRKCSCDVFLVLGLKEDGVVTNCVHEKGKDEG
jgi:hypothetical protein